MLNLNDLNTNYGSNFFDVSTIKLKRAPDDDDNEEGLDVSRLHSRALQDSVGSRSVTSPWEFDIPSMTSSNQHRSSELMSNFASNEGGGIFVGADHLYRKTPDTSFAILGDANPLSSLDSSVTYTPPHKQLRIGDRVFRIFIACTIFACLVLHVVGLLIYFTPWYNNTIQVFIFRQFYSSFSAPGFEGDIDAKRSGVAFVYLLFVGLVPTTLSASLWFMFAECKDFRSLIQPPQLLRRKPVLLSTWRPVYVDATYGELIVLTSLVFANAFIFIHSLLRNKTEASSPREKIWRDVGRAFGFDATFNLVGLVLVVGTPSSWTVYLDFLGISSSHLSRKYRIWLGFCVVITSIMHTICMAVHFDLLGNLSSQLFPRWSSISTSPSVGANVFGEIAFGALLITAIAFWFDLQLRPTITSFAKTTGGSVFMVALGVHYPVSIAWVLPLVALLLIHKSVFWTHARRQVKLADMAPLPNKITRIVVQANPTTSEFVPGQVIYINIPQVSWTGWLRCSVTSAPSRSPGLLQFYVHPPLDLTRASSDDARIALGIHDTAKVAYALKKSPVVYVDGFYGTTHRTYYEKYPCLVLIANDIGIVGVLSMLEELYHEAWVTASTPLDQKIFREFGNELQENNASFEANRSKEPLAFGYQVWLLWTSADVCLFKEFEDLFFRIKVLDPHEIHFKLRFFLTEIPVHEDLRYQRLPSVSFRSSSVDDTPAKARTRQQPTEAQDPDDLTHSPNQGLLTCWSPRPFHQSLSNPLAKTVTMWIVLCAAIPVSILVEWFALRTQISGVFPPIRLLRNVLLVFLTCVGVATVTALMVDVVATCQRDVSAQSPDHAVEIRQGERKPHTRGLRRLRSMATMVDESESDHRCDVERSIRDTVPDPGQIGPDVMERLMIYSMRPDIDKFLQTVGRSFPRFAGTIGVFASGDKSLLAHVEQSVLASETRIEAWKDVRAVFDLHCMH